MKAVEHFKDFVEKGVKHLGIIVSFGAYHLYVMDEKFKLQDTLTQTRIQEMNRLLEEQKKLSAKSGS